MDIQPRITESTIGVWFAHSPSSNIILAKIRRGRFSLAGVDINYVQLRAGGVDLHLSSQFIFYSRTDFPVNGKSGQRDNRRGFGITPLRITVPLTQNRSYPYVSAGGGLMMFRERFPNDSGTRLNATVDLGIGYNADISDYYRFDFGYRFHHLSNGNTGRVNPGIDSNLFVVTLQLKIPRN